MIKKQNFAREFALVCAPIFIIGGLFGWSAWQKRDRTPQIKLTVRTMAPTLKERRREQLPLPFSPDSTLRFRWDATLQGGPLSNYHFGWNERITALTPRGSLVVWQIKNQTKNWQIDAVNGTVNGIATKLRFSAGHNKNNLATHFHEYEIDENALPLDTRKLQWQDEIVAIPSDDANVWHQPCDAGLLRQWAKMPGAAHWKDTLDLPYSDAISGPVLMRSQKSEEPNPGSVNEIKIEILLRQLNRRSFGRLVAFDGTNRRILWTSIDEWNGHKYWRSWGSTGAPGRDGQTLAFDIGNVPATWGEIVFLNDVVFDVAGRGAIIGGTRDEWLSEKALLAFEKQTGGFRVKRRLVLRPRL